MTYEEVTTAEMLNKRYMDQMRHNVYEVIEDWDQKAYEQKRIWTEYIIHLALEEDAVEYFMTCDKQKTVEILKSQVMQDTIQSHLQSLEKDRTKIINNLIKKLEGLK